MSEERAMAFVDLRLGKDSSVFLNISKIVFVRELGLTQTAIHYSAAAGDYIMVDGPFNEVVRKIEVAIEQSVTED